jgi:hypothetical protein
MTVRLLKTFLAFAALITVVAGLVGLVSVIGTAAGGSAAITTLQLRIDPATSTVVKDVSGASVGTLLLDKATLDVRAGGAGYAALQAVDILLTCGLTVALLLMVRKLVGQIGAGQPFNALAVKRLRWVGWMLISLNLWYWLRQIALPPVLLSALQTTVGDFHILPMISESVSGLRSARVDGQLGFGLFGAGALALVLAEAFRLGAVMREDNESIL